MPPEITTDCPCCCEPMGRDGYRDGDNVVWDVVTRTREWVDTSDDDENIQDGVFFPRHAPTGYWTDREVVTTHRVPASSVCYRSNACKPTASTSARLEWVRDDHKQLVLRCYIGGVGIDVATINRYDDGFFPYACRMERSPPWHDKHAATEAEAVAVVSAWAESAMHVSAPINRRNPHA